MAHSFCRMGIDPRSRHTDDRRGLINNDERARPAGHAVKRANANRVR